MYICLITLLIIKVGSITSFALAAKEKSRGFNHLDFLSRKFDDVDRLFRSRSVD